jgi:hypothetical protein
MRILFILGVLGLALPRPSVAATAKAWEYTREVTQVGGIVSANAMLPGNGGSALWLGCARDSEGRPFVSAAVTGDRLLGTGSLSERVTLLRFDGRMPDVSRWTYRGRSGLLASRELAVEFTERLVAAKRVAIDLSDYRLSVWQVVFDLDVAETGRIVSRLKKDCEAAATVATDAR